MKLKISILPATILILAAFSAYLPAMQGGVVWDDDVHIFQNPDMGSLVGLKRVWSSERAYYYPLTTTVFWLLHKKFGGETFPYHFLNILLHLANALLFWRLLARFQMRGAALAAFLFALHPVHVESVAWMTELKNLLACFFLLLAALSFTKLSYRAAIVFFILSILSKPAAAAFPLALLLYLWWRNRQEKARPLLVMPFFLVSLAAGAWTIWEQTVHSGAEGNPWSLSLMERVLVAGRAFWFYLGKIFWPHPLSFLYPRWEMDAARPTAYLWPLALAGLFLFLVFLKRNFARNILFVLGVYLAMLLPILGFFNVYFFRYSFAADHFQYIASLAPMALAAFYLDRLKAAGFLILPVFWLLTFAGSARFQNVEILWRETIRTNPAAWLAHNNLANILMKRGQASEALPHYEAALRHNPTFAEAHSNIAVALMRFKRYEEAMEHFKTALRYDPDSAEYHNNLATAYTDLGKSEEAIREYREALRLKSGFALARRNLAHELRGIQEGQ